METIILFAPLIGALIAGFGWRSSAKRRRMVTTRLLFSGGVPVLGRVPVA